MANTTLIWIEYQGLREAIATSFFALFVVGGVEYFINDIYYMAADHARKYTSQP